MTVPAQAHAISIVGINYPPERTGIAPYTGALARALVNRGCQVDVTTAHPHYPEWRIYDGFGEWSRDEEDRGVTVHRRLHYVPKKTQGLQRLLSEITFGLRSSFGGGIGKPDVILMISPALFSTAITGLWARIRHPRTPRVVWVQDLYGQGVAETAGSGFVEKVMRAVEGYILRKANRVVVIHDRFKKDVCEDYGVDPEHVSVVRNWTHIPAHGAVDRASAREDRGWAEESVVLHAGNMGVKQGLDHVIYAARRAQERGEALRFVLLGGGAERARLEELAEGLDNVDFLDCLDDEHYCSALGAADVLLVHEAPGVMEMAVPSKLTSYFDAARPVLAATSLTGITAEEVETAGAGAVVASGDPDALVDAALALAADQDKAREYGENGRAYREAVLTESAAIDAFCAVLGVPLPDTIAEPVPLQPERARKGKVRPAA
ncbi:glycosyltransferase family 4 protein [Demequina silvatica]|uniref:glycosyltransferase family 4 protein n=1 Tax=Demequina silvatica TaxID=1638988 RepID=UPI001E5B6980|nr:glycosyltransferase family 4 protein [Demequina silvatica]